MADMDEKVPASTPGYMSPQAAALSALLYKQFGQPSAAAGMPQDQRTSTPAITPLGDATGRGGVGSAASPAMPAGVSGVPPTNMPSIPSGPTERAMPTPSNIPFSYPNQAARQGAVVKTGIENISEAIHNFKVKKDTDEFQKAKNTWDLYQKASALNPQTGQPVDPHTMEILKNDPKIVKGWEKYLKMEFPRESASPSAQGASGGKGKPQGSPIIPPPTAPAGEQAKALIEQRKLEQLRGAPNETGSLTPSEAHLSELMAAGILPKALSEKDIKEIQKIDAEISDHLSQAKEHDAQVAKLTADLTTIPLENTLKRQQALTELALEKKYQADAWKDYHEATKSKGLQEFVVAQRGVNSVYSDVSKELTKSQAQAMRERGRVSTALGLHPDPTPEQDALQDRLRAIGDMKSDLATYQDDIESGKVTATDAVREARRSAGLTSDYRVWDGVPNNAPDAKKLPDGTGYPGPNGEVIGVVVNGKWVAP